MALLRTSELIDTDDVQLWLVPKKWLNSPEYCGAGRLDGAEAQRRKNPEEAETRIRVVWPQAGGKTAWMVECDPR